MHLQNRLIAMLDVLGLSSQIQEKSNLPIVIEKYKELISKARNAVFSQDSMPGSEVPKVVNFEVGEFVFDTIILVSLPIDIKSTCNFVLSTIRLMELFSVANMPLRGAIGIGDYCSDESNQIFLSNIFKVLSNEEQNQQWTGCVISPDAEDEIIMNLMGLSPEIQKQSDVMHKISIPSKKKVEIVRWCLNWAYHLSNAEQQAILDYMKGDKLKQQNTNGYLDYLASLPDDSQQLSESFKPAVKLKALKTRGSMRVRFENENSDAVEPGCKQWSIGVFQ